MPEEDQVLSARQAAELARLGPAVPPAQARWPDRVAWAPSARPSAGSPLVSRGLMQVVQPDPRAALARWADRQADPLADLRAAFHLAEQVDLEALAAQQHYLQETLERAAAQWYQTVALPLREALERGVVHLGEALRPLGEALERAQREALSPEARVLRLRGEVAELRTALDQWEAEALDPALSSPEGLAQAGLLGVLVGRREAEHRWAARAAEPPSQAAADPAEAAPGLGEALLADQAADRAQWAALERERRMVLNYHLLAVNQPGHLTLLTGL